MTQEILYTSAPQGLRPGSSGYCTVGSTSGIEPNLVDFLEGFSGYPHPYKPPDPKTKFNPVAFSYFRWSIGGQRLSVLSRICDSGLDYTGRTNLLAHHVVLNRRETDQLPAGPAALMAAPDFFVEKWDGAVKTIPARSPRAADVPLSPCLAWQAAAGDAGYAGVLAEAAQDKNGRPISVIYGPGGDMLTLLLEVLRLLPPEKRWEVSFTTFDSRIYSSFDCRWRFVFDGMPEAQRLRRDSRAAVIDLVRGGLPPAQGGALVVAAREGKAPASISAPSSSARTASESRSKAKPVLIDADDEPGLLPPVRVASAEALTPAETQPRRYASASRRSSSWWYYAGGAGFIWLIVMVMLLVLIFKPQEESEILAKATRSLEQKQAEEKLKPPPPPEPPKKVEVEAPREIPVKVETVPEPARVPKEPPPAATPVIEVVSSNVPSSSPEPEPIARMPFEDVDKRERRLKLPKRKKGVSESVVLCSIFAPQESCNLRLLGIGTAFDVDESSKSAVKCELTLEETGKRIWIVEKPGTALTRQEIARFELHDDQLSFRWNDKVRDSAKPDALENCLVELAVGKEFRRCQFRTPTVEPAVPVLTLIKDGVKPLGFSLPAMNRLVPEADIPGMDGWLMVQKENFTDKHRGLGIWVYKSDKEGIVLALDVRLRAGPDESSGKLAPGSPTGPHFSIETRLLYRPAGVSLEDLDKKLSELPLDEKDLKEASENARESMSNLTQTIKRRQVDIDKRLDELREPRATIEDFRAKAEGMKDDKGKGEIRRKLLDDANLMKAAIGKAEEDLRKKESEVQNLHQNREKKNREFQLATEALQLLDKLKTAKLELRISAVIFEGEKVEIYRTDGMTRRDL